MPSTNWIQCPMCKGKGKIPIQDGSSVMKKCPRCHGENNGRIKVLSPR